jgi:hypothetical protein
MSLKRMRLAAGTGVSLLVIGAVGAGSAHAHTDYAPTQVNITGGGPQGAYGTVTSLRPLCNTYIDVDLNRDGQLVGRARTDAKGNWAVQADLTAGTYTAVTPQRKGKKVTTRRKRKKGKKRGKKRTHRHGCAGATSPPTRL